MRHFYTSSWQSEDRQWQSNDQQWQTDNICNGAERNIRIASEEIKKAEQAGKHNKTAKLERIIELSERMKECAKAMRKPFDTLDRLGFGDTNLVIQEGWAIYFEEWILANLLKKEITSDIPKISEMDSLPAMTYAIENKDNLQLKESSREIIYLTQYYFNGNKKDSGVHGEGFKKFENLSKGEAKELAVSYLENIADKCEK